jgi:hypothetical protein
MKDKKLPWQHRKLVEHDGKSLVIYSDDGTFTLEKGCYYISANGISKEVFLEGKREVYYRKLLSGLETGKEFIKRIMGGIK